MANVLGELFGNIAAAIREKTGDTATMKPAEFPNKIAAIEVGGGSSADVCYVTFMNEDGTEEYGKKAVAVGDDCADPLVRGVFDTPTKESTDQYNYTHDAWSTEPNGGTNADALKNVTEDRTVYATFIATVRTYTISYYDGEELLKSVSVAYGLTPSYTPSKEGYTFTGWSPELATVTGDASYYAQWVEQLDFNALSWAKIAEYAESGQAAEKFALGAKKTFLTQQSVSVTAEIIGFNHDDLSDGSGKAGITLKLSHSFDNQYPITSVTNGVAGASWHPGEVSTYASCTWGESDINKYWNNTGKYYMMQYVLPSALTAVIKQVSKKYSYNAVDYTSDCMIFLESATELGFGTGVKEGECYEAYTSGKNRLYTYSELVRSVAGTAYPYATRSKYTYGLDYVQTVTAEGGLTTTSGGNSIAKFPCFCI